MQNAHPPTASSHVLNNVNVENNRVMIVVERSGATGKSVLNGGGEDTEEAVEMESRGNGDGGGNLYPSPSPMHHNQNSNSVLSSPSIHPQGSTTGVADNSTMFVQHKMIPIPQSSYNILRARRGVIRMLIVVVLTFALCNLPFHARKIWQYR